MKSYNEFVKSNELFEGFDVSQLSESQIIEAAGVYNKLNAALEEGGVEAVETKLAEGILGAIAGFIVGPAIGKVVANALGIQKGILYDMFTSRLVSAALGSAIQNNMK
jgi:hypothetical protein